MGGPLLQSSGVATPGLACNPSRLNRSVVLKRPRPEQEIDDASLMRLQPVELDRRDRSDVQPVDVRRVDQRSLELLVFRYRRANQRRPNLFKHLLLGALDDGAEG